MDQFVTFIVALILPGSSVDSSADTCIWFTLGSFSMLICITESSLLVPVIEHCDIGLESLCRRLSWLILSSMDHFGELVYGVSFADVACPILINDVEVPYCD